MPGFRCDKCGSVYHAMTENGYYCICCNVIYEDLHDTSEIDDNWLLPELTDEQLEEKLEDILDDIDKALIQLVDKDLVVVECECGADLTARFKSSNNTTKMICYYCNSETEPRFRLRESN